jgi:hypothetical protein
LFVKHKFTHIWQAAVRREAAKTFDANTILIELDFAENLTIKFQDAQQSQHWVQVGVSLLNVIATYHDDAGEVITKAIVFVSNDLDHDTQFTQKSMAEVMRTIRGWAPKRTFDRVWVRSDGAPSHFKNRFTLGWLREMQAMFELDQLWWDFSAPQHGKGPWDGIGALVKNYILRDIKHEKISPKIAEDVYKRLVGPDSKFNRECWSSQAQEKLHAVEFKWLEKFTRAKVDVTSIPGVRSNFMFSAIRGQGWIAVRELSCYCNFCKEEKWLDVQKACRAEQCENRDVVGLWTLVKSERIDRSGIGKRSGMFSKRGVKLANEVSSYMLQKEGVKNVDVDKRGLRKTEKLVVLRAQNDEQCFAFWLARITERKSVVKGKNPGFKKGDNIVCVQLLERYPPQSPNNFKLGVDTDDEVNMSEYYVHVGGIRALIDVKDIMARPDVIPPGPLTRAARAAAAESGEEKFITGVYLSDAQIKQLHQDIEQFEFRGSQE